MTSTLEVTNVDQVFRLGFWLKQVHVLKQVNLNVPEKSIFGFLGANGAGKTTLIHLIVGTRQPTRGSVKVFGFPSDTVEAKANIGFLPERPYFYQHLTGEGLLKYFGNLAGMQRSRIESQIPKVLSAVGLTAARKVELKNYSKGMLQRIGIAQALIHDPSFLVLDEPMSGLDPLGRKEIRELILQLAAEGRTIFFSSHVIPDIEAICDHVAFIDKGRLLASGPITKFHSQEGAQMEIGFGGIRFPSDSQWPEFESIKEIPDGYKALVSGRDTMNSVIARLLQAGGVIHWVNPVHVSLEDYFKEKQK